MMILDMATGETEQAPEWREPEAAATGGYRDPQPLAALQQVTATEAKTASPDACVLAGLDIAAFVDAQR